MRISENDCRNNESVFPGFLSLLQFVSVSDMTLNLAQSGIKDSTARMQSSIVLALTVVSIYILYILYRYVCIMKELVNV